MTGNVCQADPKQAEGGAAAAEHRAPEGGCTGTEPPPEVLEVLTVL